jgi:photosystem II stability/assembly factor-like uncharacterized protein
MKRLFYVFALLSGGMFSLLFSGCELVTPVNNTGTHSPLGTDLIIQELYTIPPDKFYAETWIQLFNPTGKAIPWITTSTPATGYACGTNGTIVRMLNGSSWSVVFQNPSLNLHALGFAYADTGFAVGDKGVVVKLTAPQGVPIWTVMDSTKTGITSDLYAILFPTVGNPLIGTTSKGGFVGGANGNIYVTGNRGVTWSPVTHHPPTTASIRSLCWIFDLVHDWACGDSGLILKTVNSGNTWTKITPSFPNNVPINFHCINFFDPDTGLVVGDNGSIYLCTSGSAASSFFAPETAKGITANLRGCVNLSGGYAWAVGDKGTIIASLDYGKHWGSRNSGVTANLNSVQFLDTLEGWAFGDNGVIVSTTDGGYNWQTDGSGSTANLAGSILLPKGLLAEQDRYVVQMTAVGKEFYIDPNTGIPNYNFFPVMDTGYVWYDPVSQGIGIPGNIQPGGFGIIENDSTEFLDHFQDGPGQVISIRAPIGLWLGPLPNRANTIPIGRSVIWDLTASGEVQLYHIRTIGKDSLLVFNGQVVGTYFIATQAPFIDTLDIVRYGNYKPGPYPNNMSAPPIPIGWSLTRYFNDVGTVVLPPDPAKYNTAASFYLNNTPIPGWTSQLRKGQ